MKYLPLVRAGLWRKPIHPILTFVSMTIALILAGLTMGIAAILPHAGNSLDMAADAIAGLGFAMILFLTVNAMAQSVRERRSEFAVLRALGFSSRRIVALIFLEAAIPCLGGALASLAAVEIIFVLLVRFLFARLAPPSLSGAMVVLGLAAAVAVAFAATALPARRIMRQNLASALAGR